MSANTIRLLGILGALLLGVLFLLLRPDPPASEFVERGGVSLSNVVMATMVMGLAIGFARWVLSVWAFRTISASELQVTGAALSIMAAIFGAGILAMWFVYGY
jgi:hypothetical protein